MNGHYFTQEIIFRAQNKQVELCNSGFMPTVDSNGNINKTNHNKTNIIDFYSKARPELKIDWTQGVSKYIGRNEFLDTNDQNELFRTATGKEGSSRTQSHATSVNTTFLGSNGIPKPTEKLKLTR